MLIVHAIFGLVALGHMGGFMLGYEHDDIQLGEGKKYGFEDCYEIEVTKVIFVNELKVLEKKRNEITSDEFDYEGNFAEIVLKRNGQEVSRERISLLNPITYRDIQITLRAFIIPPHDKGGNGGAVDQEPWLSLTVSKNPVLKIFLILYPMMIAGIFVYLILTWRLKNNNTK
jgi:hypothetical protein